MSPIEKRFFCIIICLSLHLTNRAQDFKIALGSSENRFSKTLLSPPLIHQILIYIDVIGGSSQKRSRACLPAGRDRNRAPHSWRSSAGRLADEPTTTCLRNPWVNESEIHESN